jgi:hypothetical protein
VTDAELRALLLDCLTLWDVEGRVNAADDGLEIAVAEGRYVIERAPDELRPVRWFLQTPERRSAGRTPRAAPSVVALLSALRNAIGASRGNTARIGPGGSSAP